MWEAFRQVNLELTAAGPTLVGLDHTITYNSSNPHPASSPITAITEAGSPAGNVQVGVLDHDPVSTDRNIVLVNRMARPTDTRALLVTLREPHDARVITDVATGQVVAQLAAGQKKFNLTMTPGDGRILRIAPCGPVSCGATVAAGQTLSLGAETIPMLPGARIIVRGTLVTNGTAFTSADPNTPWAGIVVDGGSVVLSGGAIEGADVGLAVYAPGTAAVSGLSFEGNRIGLDVLTNTGSGATCTGCMFDGNEVAVRSDYIDDYNPGTAVCFTGCRSTFAITNSCVRGSTVTGSATGYGIWARNADARITGTTVLENGAFGLRVDNAQVRAGDVLVTLNGTVAGSTRDGVRVGDGGDLLLYAPADAATGGNIISDNARHEISATEGAYVVFSSAFTTADPPPLNVVSKMTAPGSQGRLVSNNRNDPMNAANVFWGSASGPPSGAFNPNLPPVLTTPHLTANPAPNAGNPACPLPASAGSRSGDSAQRLLGGGRLPDGVSLEALADTIRALRGRLERHPGGGGAVDLLRELYGLQRLDRRDTLGERSATMGLLALLRERLAEPDLADSVRVVAEAALLAELDEAVLAEDYAGAVALVAGPGASVQDPANALRLRLAEVTLDEQAGRYDEALARIAALVATLSEDEEDRRQDLLARAALIAERQGEGGDGGAAKAEDAASVVVQEDDGLPEEFALLAARPNPFESYATIPLDLPAPAEVRVEVFDVLGRRVAVLVDGPIEAGRHQARFDGSALASGVYIVRAVVEPEGGTARRFVQRVTLLR